MDTLRLELVAAPALGPSDPAVDYVINGRDLLTLVREVERPYAVSEGHPNLAGDYAPLPHYWFRESPEYFLGNEIGPARWPGSPWTVLYACGGCREVGCWPLLVTIESAVDVVRWSDFRQPYRAPGRPAVVWEYDALGPFVFDRSLYETELRRLHAEIGMRTLPG